MKRWIMLAFAVSLAGCATATPYQPLDRGFGYAEQRVQDDRYRVSFSGNDATPRATVETYLLFRAAELTLENGKTHFLVTGTDTESQTTFNQTINTGFGVGRFSRFGTGIGVGVGTASPRSTRYEAQALVILLDEDVQRDELRAFEAESVLRNIGPTVQRPDGA